MDKKDELPTYEAVVENIVDVDELEKKPLPAPPKNQVESSKNDKKSSFNFFGLMGSATEYSGTLNSTGIVETFKLVVEPHAKVQVYFEDIKEIQIEYEIQWKNVITHHCEMSGTTFEARITSKGKMFNWFFGNTGQVVVRIPTFFNLNIDFHLCGEVSWNGGTTLLQNVHIISLAGAISIDNMYASSIEIESMAGGIKFSNATSSKIILKSSGGSIKTHSVTADDLLIDSAAGGIECTEYKITNVADIQSSAGSIKAHIDFVQNSKGKADIYTSAGSVQAIVTGYKELSLNSSAGSIKADLAPHEISHSKLSSSAGSVTANIKNFMGTYECSTSAGSSRVRRNGEKVTRDFDVLPGNGTVKANSSAGSVTLNFEY
ncbi:hypothetical protein HDV01_003206 [Terramyces sp. JEL0728]|nr:hypothetical protein HDV01_003206 [Terramyces sp. JEL0728]